jgi:hypothetical protein
MDQPPFSKLTICPACSAWRVCPMRWAERESGRWWLRLRCGECGAARDVVIARRDAQWLNVDIQEAADELEEALRAFERECMVAEGRCWTRALELDLIDAADFARGLA